MANLVPTTLGKLPGTMSSSVFRLEGQDQRSCGGHSTMGSLCLGVMLF